MVYVLHDVKKRYLIIGSFTLMSKQHCPNYPIIENKKKSNIITYRLKTAGPGVQSASIQNYTNKAEQLSGSSTFPSL
jgi:hypothetical protein